MFEKSLYDLIRGLRSHKGNETEYIQSALKECRNEVRSKDMDVKATALLKLIYLEMFGYDMSWAAFNVLEVMSSSKHLQKRVGYLGAVQTFRPDTEVLMLATNLLQKDLMSASIPTMSLPLITLPHIITSSLATSLLTDLLPRLSHSQPTIRKKTIVTLYRLALVYPETLRVAWPKIKQKLMDEEEDPSVTAAVVNVVCELGWRRPHDFLPLAPRLFDLLIEGGNNWTAIKIIKLFATLTPLEPRLVKKLVRPLTNLIQSTTAMSLLYECINGIIQGGILDSTESSREDDEVANLCISKLRSMIVVEGDPNLKYVALLAFNRIVVSHPVLVSMQQDVIMGSLDDPDVSIRLQALELVLGMVSSDNLQLIVDRLIKQMRNIPVAGRDSDVQKSIAAPIEPSADSGGEDPEEKLTPVRRSSDIPPLPNEYRREVVNRILDMSSQDNYANITDFEWYLGILTALVCLLPPKAGPDPDWRHQKESVARAQDMAERIGNQFLDVAVRVKVLRAEATHAAETLLLVSNRAALFPSINGSAEGVLAPLAWIAGEFAEYLSCPQDVLDSLIHETVLELPAPTVSAFVQAIPKVFSAISAQASRGWESSQRTALSMLLARMVAFLEQLATHPNLDVQERSVEFLELLRLAVEALSSQPPDVPEPPLLITSAIPNLFSGSDLKPVAVGAQKKVPMPEELDLDMPINDKLSSLLQSSQIRSPEDSDHDGFWEFYNESIVAPVEKPPTFRVTNAEQAEVPSYQAPEDAAAMARRKAERVERNKDDPFYIPQGCDNSGRSTPFHDILRNTNGEDLDIDAIPIVDLQIAGGDGNTSAILAELQKRKKRKKVYKKFEVAADETIGSEDSPSGVTSRSRSLEKGAAIASGKPPRPKKNLLQVDSSGLRQVSLEGAGGGEQLDVERREAEEEMAAAMRQVERLRLEMQRAADRTETAAGVDATGTEVKRKKKRQPKLAATGSEAGGIEVADPPVKANLVKKKTKKKKTTSDVLGDG